MQYLDVYDYSLLCLLFFFKQKTAYEMRISDWSSDVCSSDLWAGSKRFVGALRRNAWLFLLPLAIIALAKLKGSYDNTQFADYFVRNAIIVAARDGGWERWAFGDRQSVG